MEKITGEIVIPQEKIDAFKTEIKNTLDLKTRIDQSITLEATEILSVILEGAIALNASDVHLEPEEEASKIRIRIDGLLQDISSIPTKIYNLLLSRIKLLSGLKINVTENPQDGRFSIIRGKEETEIRSSSLPTKHGESLVLRILNPLNIINLEELGMREDLLKEVAREIKKPNGMIIVTGPTGSGKTTTLYSFLKKLQNPEIKIITIEDPIEYKIEGISQTQVEEQKGYTFANGLRSILRQDPDVVLVGEIRDFDTAQIACQAALTGHLVLTTLHTNDAAGTIARLLDLGVQPNSVAPALTMAIAQRLVRKVCGKCASFSPVPQDILEKIKTKFENIKSNAKLPSFEKPIKIATAKGCPECNFTGYKGRLGIYETFSMDPEMEKFILKSPSVSEMRDLAIKKGMITMYQDGLLKVFKGETTMEEIERVTGEE